MKTILIVDDKEENLYFLRSLLLGHGFQVAEARNGAEALDLARVSPPSMVISDLFMPQMDGYALLRHWKMDKSLMRIPFVVYTATYTDPRDEALARSLGADAFILKPAEPEPFMARLEAVLEKAQQGGLTAPAPVPADPEDLLEAQAEVLIRKLEKKARDLEKANADLRGEIAERRRAEDGLRSSEERFRELAETVQEAFWIAEPGLRKVLYASPAYERIWGRSLDTLYRSPAGLLESVHDDDRDMTLSAARDLETLPGGGVLRFRIRREDGAIRWIRSRAYPVRDKDGRLLRLVGAAEDITDQCQLEEQFRRTQKLEALGRLASGIAHDFNNIMAVILGYADLASTMVLPPAAENALREITGACEKGREMVSQILTFSRQNNPERKRVSLGSTVEEAVRFMRAVVPSHVALDLSLDPDAPMVLANPTQIHQVIANLVTNAWHAMDGTSGRITLHVGGTILEASEAGRLAGMRPGGALRISISDTGKGMDAATLERIFDPFFTTKPADKGTGLGLSVVQGIIQGHDGAITVASQPGQGTTFIMYLPAADPAPSVPETQDPAKPLRASGQRILYVDDEGALVRLATKALEDLGYRVSGFESSQEAMQAFLGDPGRFDLAVLDMNMPGLTGLELASRLLRTRPGLPVLLCSGHVTPDLRQLARNAGIREVLFKSAAAEEFGEAIHRKIAGTLGA